MVALLFDKCGAQAGAELARQLHGLLGEDYATDGARCVDGIIIAPDDASRLGGFEQLAPSRAYDAICRPFGRTRPGR